jgi:hypothetical protein
MVNGSTLRKTTEGPWVAVPQLPPNPIILNLRPLPKISMGRCAEVVAAKERALSSTALAPDFKTRIQTPQISNMWAETLHDLKG